MGKLHVHRKDGKRPISKKEVNTRLLGLHMAQQPTDFPERVQKAPLQAAESDQLQGESKR
eukprot:6206975-Pleurochrysis_carterae.AAC.2